MNLLGRVSCSSDGGVDDGGKKRKPFVDRNSLINVTFVSRLFGRIDALLLQVIFIVNLGPKCPNNLFQIRSKLFSGPGWCSCPTYNNGKVLPIKPYKQLIRACRAPN